MSAEKFQNPVVRWIDHRLPVFSMLDHEKYDYPVPKNLNYMSLLRTVANKTEHGLMPDRQCINK